MHIRRLTADDLPAIAAIQQASPEAAQWNPDEYLEHEGTVAIFDGRIVAFLITRTVAHDEHEILNIATAPEWRRRGIAKRLISEVKVLLRGAIFLEVRASNRAALQLYKSLDFVEVARRDRYYSEPPEAAIVMKFHSC